ncbi:MAG: ABC transporter ATP-binding protein [Bdellovibrionota bacterium]
MPLLEVTNLKISFDTDVGPLAAVDGLDFTIDKGETLCLVGESGCGKSVTALSLLRLIASPPGRIASGKIVFDGQDILTLSDKDLRKIRGRRIAMVFQEPMTSLNPVYTVEDQIAEVLKLHLGMNGRQAGDRVAELLSQVGIPAPRQRMKDYPHQLSGGMRQRVMIAMALACNPDLLIADEPTTALDVTIQAQILELLGKLQSERGLAILLITHDMGVVAEVARRVAIMYAGRIVETGPVGEVFARPLHPYTRGLLAAIPRTDAGTGSAKRTDRRLSSIRGQVPSLARIPSWCRFADRCPDAQPRCRETDPRLETKQGHDVACVVAS